MMNRRLLTLAAALGIVLASVLYAPAAAAERKKKKKEYDYENSKYKAYKVLTDWHQFHFDDQGNPVADHKGTKVRRVKKKQRRPEEPAGTPRNSYGGAPSGPQP